jgi:protein O-mannosyl-transferase
MASTPEKASQEPRPLRRGSFFARPAVILALVAIVSVILYWPGLSGPFVFDDRENLRPVARWAAGEIPALQALLGGIAGPTGRPLAIASFMFDAWVGGLSGWQLKAGNLLLHLANGAALFVVARRLFSATSGSVRSSTRLALACAALWLLLPIHVGTVLYVVQRMALLASLASLVTIALYLSAREQQPASGRKALLLLYAAIPLAVLAGTLGKENALLALPMCAAIGFLLGDWHRGLAFRVFMLAMGAAPVALLAGYLAINPASVTNGYEIRDFTALERMLTQGRVLLDYAIATFLPIGPRMAVFQDDYAVSHSLLDPASTLISWLILCAAAAAMWLCRKRLPVVSIGLAIFFIGHAMESTIAPLELVFQHRQYLPSAGLVLAACALGTWAVRHLEISPRRAAVMLAISILVYAASTAGRAVVWSNAYFLFHQSHTQRPASLRSLNMLALIEAEAGNRPAARDYMNEAVRVASRHTEAEQLLFQINLSCAMGQAPDPEIYSRLKQAAPERLSRQLASNAYQLAARIQAGGCPAVPPLQIAEAIETWLEQSTTRRGFQPAWYLRYTLALLYRSAGDPARAATLADDAFRHSRHQFAPGILAFDLHQQLGNNERAREIADRLEGKARDWNHDEHRAIERMRSGLGRAAPAHSGPSAAPSRARS